MSINDIDVELLSPMMKQYVTVKNEHADALLFYRLGDFYELFFDDAVEASRVLDLTLTGRNCGLEERAPMCGVPYHSAQGYIDRLIDLGYRVAICEQASEPNGKDLVKREVIQVVTAGTVTSETALDNKSNNFLACVYYCGNYALSFADITTGEVYATEILGSAQETQVMAELSRFMPREILLCNELYNNAAFCDELKKNFAASISGVDDERYAVVSDKTATALNALTAYLEATQLGNMPKLKKPKVYGAEEFLQLDYSTKKNLEITTNLYKESKANTLLACLDKTKTSFGARLLRKWLDMPLYSIERITERQDVVAELLSKFMLRKDIEKALAGIQDIERIMGRISTDRATPRDLASLASSLKTLPEIGFLLGQVEAAYFSKIKNNFDTLEDISDLIGAAIADEPPISAKEGNLVRDGYNESVDEYRSYNGTGSKKILEMQEKEQRETGIAKLKIGYNKIIGYYIEVPKSQKSKVPESYIGKATLTNSERYITKELRELENNILGASARNNQLELEIFSEICNTIKKNDARIMRVADILSRLDVFQSLAEVAEQNGYCRPALTTTGEIMIKEGRHPVIEKIIGRDRFIANDTTLDNDNSKIAIITGPNMAGKSTFMRQVALIVIMAQVGSFVPAESATITLCDRIFSRIGASDNLSLGQSTFMVEMMEVSNILANATDKSLVILDEVGRGTSTYDGLAIAWSVVEELARVGAKTLFATHYHELIELESRSPTVANYSVSAITDKDELIFLHKVQKGGIDDSYGIEVAKMAGVSPSVIKRATEIVGKLESKGEVV